MVLYSGIANSDFLAPIEAVSFFKASSLQKAGSFKKDIADSGKKLLKINILLIY